MTYYAYIQVLRGKLYDLLVAIEELEPEIKKAMNQDPTFDNIASRCDIGYLEASLNNSKNLAINIIGKENKK